jgi:hypothetical protein
VHCPAESALLENCHSTDALDGLKCAGTRMYEIKDVYVPTQKLDELRTFLNQIAADERASAVLRRAN